jgi:hypothetical protein
MMFLIRMAFWASVVLVLLPTGKPEGQPSDRAQVSATEAVGAAASTLSDMRGFCDRQPGACAVGAQVVAVLGERAQSGAKLIYGYLTEKAAPGGRAKPQDAKGQDTLTADDRTPAWRGPASRREHPPV